MSDHLNLSKGLQNLLPFFVPIFLIVILTACDADPDSKATAPLVSTVAQTVAPHVGHLAPDFLLETLDGREVRLSDYRGHVVFLNFWATWCGPCKIEMPAMEHLYREFRPKGFAVLAVSIDAEGSEVTKPYRDALGLTFTIAHDRDGLVGRLYGVRSLPQTYMVSREGVITHQIFGARDWRGHEARTGIRQLLGM